MMHMSKSEKDWNDPTYLSDAQLTIVKKWGDHANAKDEFFRKGSNDEVSR
jgi:hypothetical protein